MFTFLLSLGWGFFLFHSNGFLRRLAYYKACLFSSSYFLFSHFPRQNSIYWISRLFFTFFLPSIGRSDLFKEKEEKKGEVKEKERCDGWKGEGGETMEVSLFSRRVMNETFVSLSVSGGVKEGF